MHVVSKRSMQICIGRLLLIGSTCMLPPAPNFIMQVSCKHRVSILFIKRDPWVSMLVWNQTLHNVGRVRIQQVNYYCMRSHGRGDTSSQAVWGLISARHLIMLPLSKVLHNLSRMPSIARSVGDGGSWENVSMAQKPPIVPPTRTTSTPAALEWVKPVSLNNSIHLWTRHLFALLGRC